MAVAPLTDQEMAGMARTQGARYPRGITLRCQCGRVGGVADVSAHRTAATRRDAPSLCAHDPDAFRTREDAELYEAEDSARQRREAFEEEDRLRLEELRLSGVIRDPEPVVKRPVGRPRKNPAPAPGESRGSAGGGGMERVEVPRPLTTRMTFEVPIELVARCDKVRLNPEYGFSGDVIQYLSEIELSYWIIIDWLAAGQPCPLAEFQAAA